MGKEQASEVGEKTTLASLAQPGTKASIDTVQRKRVRRGGVEYFGIERNVDSQKDPSRSKGGENRKTSEASRQVLLLL